MIIEPCFVACLNRRPGRQNFI